MKAQNITEKYATSRPRSYSLMQIKYFLNGDGVRLWSRVIPTAAEVILICWLSGTLQPRWISKSRVRIHVCMRFSVWKSRFVFVENASSRILRSQAGEKGEHVGEPTLTRCYPRGIVPIYCRCGLFGRGLAVRQIWLTVNQELIYVLRSNISQFVDYVRVPLYEPSSRSHVVTDRVSQ